MAEATELAPAINDLFAQDDLFAQKGTAVSLDQAGEIDVANDEPDVDNGADTQGELAPERDASADDETDRAQDLPDAASLLSITLRKNPPRRKSASPGKSAITDDELDPVLESNLEPLLEPEVETKNASPCMPAEPTENAVEGSAEDPEDAADVPESIGDTPCTPISPSLEKVSGEEVSGDEAVMEQAAIEEAAPAAELEDIKSVPTVIPPGTDLVKLGDPETLPQLATIPPAQPRAERLLRYALVGGLAAVVAAGGYFAWGPDGFDEVAVISPPAAVGQTPASEATGATNNTTTAESAPVSSNAMEATANTPVEPTLPPVDAGPSIASPAPAAEPLAAPDRNAVEQSGPATAATDTPEAVSSAVATPPAATETGTPARPAAAQDATEGLDPPVAPATRIVITVARIGPDGSGVIGGTAAPNTDLIVLHNGEPVGKTRSDANGDWVFIAEKPLKAERHEISVVPMTVDSHVVMPSAAFVPRPGRRPAPPPDHVVQLASLPSERAAQAELVKLRAKFADLFSPNAFQIKAAQTDNRREVYRIFIAGYSGASASKICRTVRARRSSCLVARQQ